MILDDLNGELMNEFKKRMEGIVKTLYLFKLKESIEQSMGNMKESMGNMKERMKESIDENMKRHWYGPGFPRK